MKKVYKLTFTEFCGQIAKRTPNAIGYIVDPLNGKMFVRFSPTQSSEAIDVKNLIAKAQARFASQGVELQVT